MIEKRVETNEPLETCLAIITSQPVLPDKNHTGCIIEEYGHAKLDVSGSLADFSRKASVPSLKESQFTIPVNPLPRTRCELRLTNNTPAKLHTSRKSHAISPILN